MKNGCKFQKKTLSLQFEKTLCRNTTERQQKEKNSTIIFNQNYIT